MTPGVAVSRGTMKRREFLKTGGAASAWSGTVLAQRLVPTASDRDAWLAVPRQLADPVRP